MRKLLVPFGLTYSSVLVLVFLIVHHYAPDGGRDFPDTDIAKLASGTWIRPRAKVTGTISRTAKEADGDFHIQLTDGKDFIICEIIPELVVEHPKVGMKIQAWGIVRHDGEHKWWELHPLIGWKEVK